MKFSTTTARLKSCPDTTDPGLRLHLSDDAAPLEPRYLGRTSRPHGAATGFHLSDDTVLLARSTTDTSLDGPLAEYSVLPSGERAIPQGRGPTSTEPTGLFVAVSIVNT